MEITAEPLENRQLRLTIEVDEERTRQAMRRTARQIAKRVNIPGFRKGKAPYDLVIRRYGEDKVRGEVAEALVETVLREAVEQEEITPYAPGVLEKVELQPLTFQFTIPLSPTLDLGDYRDYRLQPRKVRVFQKEVRQTLEEIRERNVILDPVERPAALNDRVTIDLVGRTVEGIQFLGQSDVRLLLETGSAGLAPGLAEEIVGMEAGEERTFTLTLSDDFPQEELRGQEAEFTVQVKKVYESTLPELDDDLARTVGNFDSFKELEEHTQEQLRRTAQQKADEEYATQVLADLLEQAQVEYPPVMLEKELDEAVKDVERAVQREARLSLEDYLRFQGQTIEELREDLEPDVAARIKRTLVLNKVVRLEGIEVDEEEIAAHIEQVSAPLGVRADEMRSSLNSDAGRKAIRHQLLANKAMKRLIAIARGEAPDLVSVEEQGAEEAGEAGEAEGAEGAE